MCLGWPTWYRSGRSWTDQSVGGRAAQCFARLRSLGVETCQLYRRCERHIGFKKKSQTDITGGGCAKLPRWMREEQARRRECNPKQSPNTWKTYTVRGPFVVSIDLEQFDFEDQSGVGWDDRWETTSPVCLQTLQIAGRMLSLKLRT
jgi:hypothetical protein